MVPSRQRQSSGLNKLVLAAAILSGTLTAQAQTTGSVALHLEVSIDGKTAGGIAGFELMPDGRLAAGRSDLLALGIKLPEAGTPADIVILSDIAGVKYRYDEEEQSIEFRIIRDSSNPNSFDLAGSREVPLPESITGLFVNYSLYGSANGEIDKARFTGASMLLDGHGFSRYGTLAQSQVIGVTPESDRTYTRLDTTYSISSVAHMATFNAGDLITGGLWWTAPIRIGGVQVKRDFGTRPDLVTSPLPSFSGSAAVPSTVDVFVNNIKAYSADVPEGAFELENIPVHGGSGVAWIVVRDAQGREVATQRPFYASPDLLRPGLYDYSIETGLARRNQGSKSFDYDDRLAGSASLRYGVNDGLTAETHAEGFMGLLNAGAGAVINAGAFGTISVAAAASYYEGETGARLHAGWELSKGNFNLTASSKRNFGDYADLSIATAEDRSGAAPQFGSAEQISLGYGFPDWKSNFGASFIHSENRDGSASNILSASFGQQLPGDISFYANGYFDLDDRDSAGAQAGLHIPLGGKYRSSAALRLHKDHVQATSSLTKSLENRPGGHGWRVEYGDGDYRRVSASGSYISNLSFVSGNAQYQDGAGHGHLGIDGALAIADESLFFSRRINNGFSVVDAGEPQIEVYSQNRLIGKTGSNGKILVPNLGAYQQSTIRIETDDLPLDTEIPETEAQTVVARNSASLVRFAVKSQSHSALVEFKMKDGSFVPPGSIAKLNGGGEEFILGYDGQAYISGLAPRNSAVLELAEGSCQADFDYVPGDSGQSFIDAVICQ
jgi:outer membrane usher protein